MIPVVLSQVSSFAMYYYSSSYAEFWNLAYINSRWSAFREGGG